jgi:hypothetical protein
MNTLRVLTAVLVIAAGCGDRGSTPDGKAPTDGPVSQRESGLPDGYGPLWPCSTPGQACNAHDPCAIDPVCGQDKLCHPTSLQNCKDDLPCTQDICKGLGLCENTPVAGKCALSVQSGGAGDAGGGTTELKCFDKGDKDPNDPCRLCDPDTSATKWTPANGGTCDDGNACTKDDYCQSGTCKGTYYGNICADGYSCTDDQCDGKGGCLGSKLKSDYCLINGVCYKDGANNPDGSCSSCVVSKSQSSWTPITNTCTIDSKCYKNGDKNPAGCGECDPSTSTSSWTVKGTTCCLINKVVYKTGDKDSTGCSTCDPTKDAYGWTLLSGVCKIDGTCHQKGAKNPAGCGQCDPATSTSDWTVTGTTCCWIDDKAYTSGQKDAAGCATCDPTKDPYGWTPISGMCKISGTCYTDGAKHPQGCAECKASVDPTKWTLTSTTTHCLLDDKCFLLCNGKCINLDTDASNCGTCGNKCATGLVCTKGKCSVPCTMIEDFESGSWPTSKWTMPKTGKAGTVTASAAHDGKYGLLDAEWYYETLVQVGAKGDTLTAWTRYTGSTGRTYLGFAATSSGAQSLVFAPNTGALLLQANSSWGYADLATKTVAFKANNWYLMQVEFLGGGQIKGTIFDSDGKTVVASLTHTFTTSLTGGVAIRLFSTNEVDTIRVCQN